MSEHELSVAGERRKNEIRAMLAARAHRRRVGMRVIGSAACMLLAATAILAVRHATSTTSTPEVVANSHDKDSEAPKTTAAIENHASSVQVRIVTNDPLPTTKCDGTGSAGKSAVSVCILDDAQLLSALTQTGRSYGLVKVGGKTRVVANTSPH